MGGGTAKKVEAAACALASAALGGAFGFAAYAVVGQITMAIGIALISVLAAWVVLGRIDREASDFRVTFDLGAVHVVRADEGPLELTDIYEAPLELDDVLADVGPGDRVVRLFDVNAMPTPGELRERINRHLGREAPPAASPDASQALIEALTQLRQSLR